MRRGHGGDVRIGVRRETAARERRVAVIPETVSKMAGWGDVVVEADAGRQAAFLDAAYVAAGASIGDPWDCDVLVTVAPPSLEDAGRLKPGSLLIGHADVEDRPEVVEALTARGIDWVGVEHVPRTLPRAQKMDVLSATANLAGYRAVIEAASVFPRFFPMLMTAAGTITPAQVLVIGAGVAGLSAIATARRLGAVVRAFDTRSAVREQVRSLGARFVEIDSGGDAEDRTGYAKALEASAEARVKEALDKAVRASDIVITTALVGGRHAPRLIEAETVAAMKAGSVIVDLAAARGGNCAVTRADEHVITDNGVHVLGHTDLPSRMATDSSRLYARAVRELMALMRGKGDGPWNLDSDDEVVRGVLLLRQGRRVHPAVGGTRG
jgi:NAD(P) transhydrogenase subunit alpha